MIGHEEFEEQLHGALRLLYDHARLESHPLAAALRGGVEPRGRALRRLLLDAIQELKPGRDTPRESADFYHYQYLYLRYVEARRVAEVADDLAVGERQTRRRQREAVAALARLLWPRWRALADQPPSPEAVEDDGSATALLDAELERLGTAQPSGAVDLAELLPAAVATVAPLAAQTSGRVELVARPGRNLALGSPVAIRQAVLDGLVFAVRHAPGSRVVVSLEGATVALRALGGLRPRPDDPDLAELRHILATVQGALTLDWQEPDLLLSLDFPAAQPRTVLVVDDSDDIRALFRRYLAGGAYRVVEAPGGQDIVERVQAERADCVILDVMMPSRDGWDVLQGLRGHPETRAVPVIVCTVLRQRTLALALGASDFLTKPVTREALLASLARVAPAPGR